MTAPAALVKFRVEGVEVFAVKSVGGNAQGITESLVMHDLSFAEILDGIAHVGVVDQAQNVVVGDPRLLLSCKVFVQIGNEIPLDTDIFHIGGNAGGRSGINTCGVIHKVLIHPCGTDLFRRKPLGQLIENGADHFQMRQLFRAHLMLGNDPF